MTEGNNNEKKVIAAKYLEHYPIIIENIPSNWSPTYIEDVILNVQPGFASGEHNQNGVGIPHIRPMNISRVGTIDLSEIKYISVDKSNLRLNKGNVLFNNTNSPALIGKTAFVQNDNDWGFSNHMTRLTLHPEVDYRFISHQLHYFWMCGYYQNRCVHHVNQASISSKVLVKTVPVVIPSSNEQSRIVEKIDELFSDLDQGISNLRTAQKQLKIYRQVVLKWAFEGKLTEKWRAQIQQEKLDIKTGEELLAQIKAERENLYQQQLAEWKEAVREWEAIGKLGKKPTKPQKPKDLFPLTEAELSKLPHLPSNWCWVRIGDATQCLDSMRVPINKKERERRSGNISYYGANGQVGWIDNYLFDEPLVLVVEDETFVGREKPFSYKVIGKSWVNNHAHILRPEKVLDIDYLNYQLFYYPFTPLTTGTTGRKKLTQDALINAPMKLCSIGEQQQIAQEIEYRFSICDQLEATIIENLQKAEALRQSILKQAFEGKLVPQDPNDEPAEKLLERIKQEKIKVKKGEQLSIQGI